MDEEPLNLTDLILAMRMPDMTPQFEALHRRIAAAVNDGTITDALLAECEDAECLACAFLICPHRDLLHFHHDGCPSCS